MKTHAHLLDILAGSPIFRDYQRAFSEATGLPLSLQALDDWEPVFRGVAKENPFCRMMAAQSRTCAGCLRMQEKICQVADQGARILSCPFGMTEVAVPLRLGSETVGFLRTGQIFTRPQTEADLQRVTGLLASMGSAHPPEKVREAFFRTRVLSRQQLDSVICLLTIFAEHLAIKSNLLVLREANSEPQAVTRVRQFINEHYSEDITLADAARAAHTSIYYLCKLLRKSLGMSFTELLCRKRVEDAKQLLAKPNLRVSEIAYQVGFQSLTHFNRTFKKIVGESPTEYRLAAPLRLAA